MQEQELVRRLKEFAVRVIRLVACLPRNEAGRVVGYQLTKSATSAGANYRAACRGRSKAEFVAKLGVSLEEADESEYWLEIIVDAELLPERRVAPLLVEAGELLAILAASHRTAASTRSRSEIGNPTSRIQNRV